MSTHSGQLANQGAPAEPWAQCHGFPGEGDLVRPWRKDQAGVWSTRPEGIRRSVEAGRPLRLGGGHGREAGFGGQSGWSYSGSSESLALTSSMELPCRGQG